MRIVCTVEEFGEIVRGCLELSKSGGCTKCPLWDMCGDGFIDQFVQARDIVPGEAVEEEPKKEPPQTAPRDMRCPINGAPCNECKPGAPCASDAADCNHSPFPVGMSQAEYYGITKEE